MSEPQGTRKGGVEPPLLHEMNPPSPWQPERDPVTLAILGKLSEELGELIAIVARCGIQGIEQSEPVTGKPNRDALEDELGDVYAGMEILGEHFDLKSDRIKQRIARKMAHLRAWHRLISSPSGDQEKGESQ